MRLAARKGDLLKMKRRDAMLGLMAAPFAAVIPPAVVIGVSVPLEEGMKFTVVFERVWRDNASLKLKSATTLGGLSSDPTTLAKMLIELAQSSGDAIYPDVREEILALLAKMPNVSKK